MITREDLESFVIGLGSEYEEVDDGMWVVRGGEGDVAPVVVHYSPPVVVLRLKILHLPDQPDAALAALYRRLLELNASDVVRGSYGIEAGEVILSDALELESLTFAELRNSYEGLMFAASSHLPGLAGLVPVAHEG